MVFASLRHGPAGEQVFTLIHMEGGQTAEIDPLRLPIDGLDGEGWRLALKTPGIGDDYLGGPIVLRDSMGVIFTRPAGGRG